MSRGKVIDICLVISVVGMLSMVVVAAIGGPKLLRGTRPRPIDREDLYFSRDRILYDIREDLQAIRKGLELRDD